MMPAMKAAQLVELSDFPPMFANLFVRGALSRIRYSSSSSMLCSRPSAGRPKSYLKTWLLMKWSMGTRWVSRLPLWQAPVSPPFSL